MADNAELAEYKAPDFKLTEVFNKFSRRAVKDFPELSGRFAFYSAVTDTTHGSVKTQKEEDKLVAAMKKYISEGVPHPAFAQAMKSGYYIMGWARNQGRIHTLDNAPLEDEVMMVLEHELGHLMAPGGTDITAYQHKTNFHECVADSFSLIRGKQQGQDVKAAADMLTHAVCRDFALLGDDSDHYTAPVVAATAEFLARNDVSDLTPRQCANLAYRLALRHAPPQEEIDFLQKTYAAARQKYAADKTGEALQQCALAMLRDYGPRTKTAYVFGRTVLKPFLDKDDVLRSTIGRQAADEICMTGEFWDLVRAGIAGRDRAAPETPEQRILREARDMQALGRFDRDPDTVIDVRKYESHGNQEYLQRAFEAYAAIRKFQLTGEKGPSLPDGDVIALTPDQAATAAKASAENDVSWKHRALSFLKFG